MIINVFLLILVSLECQRPRLTFFSDHRQECYNWKQSDFVWRTLKYKVALRNVSLWRQLGKGLVWSVLEAKMMSLLSVSQRCGDFTFSFRCLRKYSKALLFLFFGDFFGGTQTDYKSKSVRLIIQRWSLKGRRQSGVILDQRAEQV